MPSDELIPLIIYRKIVEICQIPSFHFDKGVEYIYRGWFWERKTVSVHLIYLSKTKAIQLLSINSDSFQPALQQQAPSH